MAKLVKINVRSSVTHYRNGGFVPGTIKEIIYINPDKIVSVSPQGECCLIRIEGEEGFITADMSAEELMILIQPTSLQKEKECLILSGYVTRDEESELYITLERPFRHTELGRWSPCRDGGIEISKFECFPHLTYKDEPIEVELKITRK